MNMETELKITNLKLGRLHNDILGLKHLLIIDRLHKIGNLSDYEYSTLIQQQYDLTAEAIARIQNTLNNES